MGESRLVDDNTESRYYRFLRDRGYIDADFLRDVLSVYLPHFAGLDRILDVGCGHGEFLQLLHAAGHEAAGIDIDPGMVKACLDQGLTAFEADALEWLPAQAAAFDGIFSSNVIEHLDVPQVEALVSACYAALRPGGLVLFAVPNPESLVVQLNEFWRDATHVRLYSRQLLEFFLHDAGFTQVESAENALARWPSAGTGGPTLPRAGAVGPASPAANVADCHVPPLPRPVRRIRKANDYWETLRSELALLGDGLALARNELVALQDWALEVEEQISLVTTPYRVSREAYVTGRKPQA
mgnify:CR=1 FL=1